MDRQLVDERDVHVPERVLEQLGQLGGSRGAHRRPSARRGGRRTSARRLDDSAVESRHHLGRALERPLGVAGIDALGRVADVEVDAGLQAGVSLEHRHQELVGRARVRRRLQHDRATAADPRAEESSRPASMWERSGTPSFSGVGTVMTAMSNSPSVLGLIDRVIPTGCQRPGDLNVGHVVNVRSTLSIATRSCAHRHRSLSRRRRSRQPASRAVSPT